MTVAVPTSASSRVHCGFLCLAAVLLIALPRPASLRPTIWVNARAEADASKAGRIDRSSADDSHSAQPRVAGTNRGDDNTAEPELAIPEGGYAFCGAQGTDVLTASPSDYRSKLARLTAGQTLRLTAGTYTEGLPVHNLDGAEGNCIWIEGPREGPPAVLVGSSSRNTIAIRDSSYLAIRDLELNGAGEWGDGVTAESYAYAHHIIIENLYIHDHDASQQVVGISTKCPAWNWIIRGNLIVDTGTGIYLGGSSGNVPFVAGLIEDNVVLDTLGYNMQIKHQNLRNPEAPAHAVTIIRNNVFSKANGYSVGSARPNLLVGHWPLSGPGANDRYLIYGNFFYQNPVEALFQGEGNIAFYANVMINRAGPAVRIQPHNDYPRSIELFHNTIVSTATGIRIGTSDPNYSQRSVGNAVFANPALDGGAHKDNVVDRYANAPKYLSNPDGSIGVNLDLHPRANALQGSTIDSAAWKNFQEWALDFDGRIRDPRRRGAYASPADDSSWKLARTQKPD